jgi:CheY-like chemotaxis protein
MNDIDIVLMDINIPGINGYEALRMIKNFKPSLPVIAQSAYS